MAHSAMTNGHGTAVDNQAPVAVNKKKAKRRAKLAEKEARKAEEFHARGALHNNLQSNEQHELNDPAEFSPDEDAHSYYGHRRPSSSNGYSNSASADSGGKRQDSRRRSPRPSSLNHPPNHAMPTEKIWNTSPPEERVRIKAFWLSLSEERRKELVRVEKHAVLKKMKEQQRHSCSCQVCGRKRIAIEEELEVLYEAYYKELEEYAHKQIPPPLLSESRRFGQLNGLHPPHSVPPSIHDARPYRGRVVENIGDEGDDDEGYSEDLVEDDEYSADDEPPPLRQQRRPNDFPQPDDFFNFGQSLTVKGGILTVADDLLKNDGKRFIEMMEQLAERRMAREADALKHHDNGYPPETAYHGPTHHPRPEPEDDDEEYDSQEEDEEYDDDEEEYDDEEEPDEAMSEKQRTEEGRRMFQIFAARMFEQRVLNAYKKDIADLRQQQLLQEEEQEEENKKAKEAKREREAAKKREKEKAKKQRDREERERKEAAKAAEEAAAKEIEAKRAEEQRLRTEENRKKREAQKKADAEEKARKEAEAKRRRQEQLDKAAEAQRKAKEAKERERKEKEEARIREKEAKEAKEREAREKRENAEKEKKAAAAEAEAAAKAKKEEDATPPPIPTQIVKRPQPPPQAPVPLPPGLHTQQSLPSPRTATVTPAIPKATAPPQRQPSVVLRDSTPVPHTPHFGSITSLSSSPHPSTPQQNSPIPAHMMRNASQSFQGSSQATSPLHSTLNHGPSAQNPFGNGFAGGIPPGSHFPPRQYDPMFQGQHQPPRPLPGFNMPYANGQMQQGRGFPPHNALPPPGFHPQSSLSMINPYDGTNNAHSHQAAFAYDRPFENATAQPIARPTPIARPSSGNEDASPKADDVDELTNHLGSRALLDDDEEGEPVFSYAQTRRSSAAPPSMSRGGFTPIGSMSNGFDNRGFNSAVGIGSWELPSPYNPGQFGASSLPSGNLAGGWPTQTNHMPAGNTASTPGPTRSAHNRSVAVRLMLCTACKQLEHTSLDGFHPLSMIRSMMQRSRSYQEIGAVSDNELLELCETEGSSHNGGGTFYTRTDASGVSIRFSPDEQVPASRALGEIGSPIAAPRQPFRSMV